jgi:hypothetical protein
MSDREYKGWRIQSRPNKIPDADGWRAYVNVIKDLTDGSLRTVPLSYEDSRSFPTKEVADQAGVTLAKAWIDHEESGGPKGGGR